MHTRPSNNVIFVVLKTGTTRYDGGVVYRDDADSDLLRNVYVYLSDYTASHSQKG
jgi:hypothetical protein